jgi:hypothetical protein
MPLTTGSNKTWATADNAVTLIAGTGKTLTARVTDIAGNAPFIPVSSLITTVCVPANTLGALVSKV